uniref:Uncharacterized protein n=1 Tax=viral metagenome TaxID=1070528 RepID=A0A6M3JI85_9ZZZZ
MGSKKSDKGQQLASLHAGDGYDGAIEDFIELQWDTHNDEHDDRAIAWYTVHQFCLENGMNKYLKNASEKIANTGIGSVLFYIKYLIDKAS